ncbi:MAG: tetratricopeptide repeat protein [Pirellulales bacterium]
MPYARRKDYSPCEIGEPVDFQLPIGELPRYFRRSERAFPSRDAYLTADPGRVAAWRTRFDELDMQRGETRPLRIGISWRAGGHPMERRRRSTELVDWLPLLSVPGVRWINLQYGETDRERDALRETYGIDVVDWAEGDPLQDLDEFAARTAALDLVISVGNTTVHLAGSLGVPAWVVLPTIPAWRWRLTGDTSPWYASVRCLRRTTETSWSDVFARAADELRAMLGDGCLADGIHCDRTVDVQHAELPILKSPGRIAMQPNGPFDFVAQLRCVQEQMDLGRWREAERLCDDALAHAPRKPAVWCALAKIARATQRPELAIRSLERALGLSEPSVDLCLELAETLHAVGRHAAAVARFEEATRMAPERFEAWLGLGQARASTNDIDGALAAFQHAESVSPNNPKVFNHRGGALLRRGENDQAVAAFRRAVALAPGYTAAWNNLGCALHESQRYDQAAECFAEIVRLEPQNETAAQGLRSCLALAEALDAGLGPRAPPTAVAMSTPLREMLSQAAEHFNAERYDEAGRMAEQALTLQADHPVALRIIGVAQRRRGEMDAAIATLRTAIATDPNNHALHFELGVCYLERYDHRTAYECFLETLRLKPNFQPCYVNLSGIMEQQERYEDATAWAKKAVESSPNCRLSLYNLGNSYREQGRIEEAIGAYQASLKVDPGYERAAWNLGICRLHLGDFAQGWPGYEMRSRVGEVDFDLYTFPLWRGESLTGKTILVHAEQGLGDEIVFCSCLMELAEKAGHVILICEPRLEKLFTRSFPGVEVHGYMRRKDRAPYPVAARVDYQLPMGSLPLYFRNSREAFPRRERFLTPDARLVDEWRARFAELGPGMKVGISWQAGGKPLERRKRSVPLDQWGPFFEIPGVDFVNLQYGDSSEVIDEVRDAYGVTLHDWEQGDPLIDVENFAAKIASLDLVISVGNATVHLAGGVGTPAWTMLPMIPSWRWMIRGDESPWYKTVRLFRQPERKNWAPVVSSLSAMLRRAASAPVADRRRAAIELPAPAIRAAAATRDKPLAEHLWLDHTQFSAGATLEAIPATIQASRDALAAGDLDRAEFLVRGILELAPKMPSALHQLGLVALCKGVAT